MTPAKPTVSVTYCRRCNFLPRAAWVAQELLHTFEDYVAAVRLVPGSGGQFDVHLDDELLFSNQAENRFPEMRELRELLAARIEGTPRPRHSSGGAEPPV